MATEHLVPLSTQALAVLRRMKALSGAQELVFPSPFYPGKPLSDGTLNSALARLGYKGVATAHGFRTLFSTCANEAGWNSDVIEKQLSHEERDDVRGAYNRAQWLSERIKLMQWWANHLQSLRAASTPSPGSQIKSARLPRGRVGPRLRQPFGAPSASPRDELKLWCSDANSVSHSGAADPIEVLRALVAAFDQSFGPWPALEMRRGFATPLLTLRRCPAIARTGAAARVAPQRRPSTYPS